jgi:hypothetical protein
MKLQWKTSQPSAISDETNCPASCSSVTTAERVLAAESLNAGHEKDLRLVSPNLVMHKQ